MNNSRIITAVALMAAVVGVSASLSGCSSSEAVSEEQLQEMVYVDRATGEAFLLRAREPLEYHPETGEQTLVPGLYCEKCQAWKPVGSMEMLQTNQAARLCPKHKTPLIADGPLPDRP